MEHRARLLHLSAGREAIIATPRTLGLKAAEISEINIGMRVSEGDLFLLSWGSEPEKTVPVRMDSPRQFSAYTIYTRRLSGWEDPISRVAIIPTDSPRSPTRFDVAIRAGGEETQVFSGRVTADEAWTDASVDLGPWSGRTVDIIFRTASHFRGAAALQSNPVMYKVRSERKNVVVYLIDALRSDHLSRYGCHRMTSPSMDAFAETYEEGYEALALLDEQLKLIYSRPDGGSPGLELYDLSSDPMEQSNLDPEDERTSKMRAKLLFEIDHRSSLSKGRPEEGELDPNTVGRRRALGYVD
jgi:hypothetical protein